METNEEPDDLDGCAIDFAAEAVDDDTAALLPLFPQGQNTPDLAAKAAEWREVLGGA